MQFLLKLSHFNKGLQYEGEKGNFINKFSENYIPIEINQSGWIRIRFIVNCEGKTGIFRIIESNENYQVQNFDERITNQLLKLQSRWLVGRFNILKISHTIITNTLFLRYIIILYSLMQISIFQRLYWSNNRH